uniref:ZP domain-containing protein n=1 Tax=Parastrongyloides trichosuri TaxID=131310 RepID=A0A0N4ZN14_PARTI
MFMITFIILLYLSLQSKGNKLVDTSVSCDQSNFIFNVHFQSSFYGLIYSENGYPNCVYVNGTIQSKNSYTIKIPLKGCSSLKNDEGNLENAIIIQENAKFLQKSDKKYLLTCIPTQAIKEQENFITVNFGGVTVDSSNTAQEVIKANIPSGKENIPLKPPNVKYSVQILNGHDLNATALKGPLNIGDDITYLVKLDEPSVDTQIGRCWASDSKSELELSDKNGCTLQKVGNIWGDFERLRQGNDVVFVNKIRAWAFPTSNEVNIFCNLRICMSGQCKDKECGKDEKGDMDLRRRRRHHDDDKTLSELEEVETVSAQIRIKRSDPSRKTSHLVLASDSSINPIFCLYPEHILIGVVTFIVIILAFIVAGYIIYRSASLSQGSQDKKFFS